MTKKTIEVTEEEFRFLEEHRRQQVYDAGVKFGLSLAINEIQKLVKNNADGQGDVLVLDNRGVYALIDSIRLKK